LVIGNRSLVIPFKIHRRQGYGGQRDFLSTIGGTCAIEAKILGFSEVRFWLSRYRKRGKKILKLAVFGAQVPAILIEKRMGDGIWRVEDR
jgi:hypothetical protein